MPETLPKHFDPASCEGRLYALWEDAGAFAANPARDAAPYAIMIPPPNVTGRLHVGHALTMTLQDILVRYRRMQGRDVLWQPGTDHAGIATQMVVERLLDAEGTDRRALGRDSFIDRVWRWKAESGGAITQQLRRLGASPDWARERFTMDEGLSVAVREVFVRLYEDGLIYRDRRLVNWDTKLGTAISDLEVESREVNGHLWHISYPLEDGSGAIVVATTRPETMLGDTAVAVHPENPRYRDAIGKVLVLPLTGRRIPVVADEYADPEKGTGAVKITPAHDFNDFEVGRRHGLTMISVLDKAGRVTLAELGAELGEVPAFTAALEGVDRAEARTRIVAELERIGALVQVEPHRHAVPHGDRSSSVIEPLLTVQWYCNAAELAKPAIAAVETGTVKFVPQQWENTFFAWMRGVEPWCISRQLWWGHRIPAWYGPDGAVYVARDEAAARAQAGADVALTQDEDVLDTWFSSALWPFSTLGWPKRTPELAKYYPTDVLVTGFDIIFFWVARMMMMGLHFCSDVPFRTVFIHGLLRDERGQKMSKSKGNVIDPMALIETYGADALRFSVAALTGPGRDVKLGPQVVESNRGFVTKLWNAARFCEMNGVVPVAFDTGAATLPLCRWILGAANRAVAAAGAALDAFRPNDYANDAYHFVWHDFCDWFLEFAKPAFATPDGVEVRAVAAHVLGVILRLLHPVMPFVTEELWDRLGYGAPGSLIAAPWPDAAPVADEAAAATELTAVIEAISRVRSVRSELNVPPSMQGPILVVADGPSPIDFSRWGPTILRMARGSEIRPLGGAVPPKSAQVPIGQATLVLPLEGLIDLDKERARLVAARAKAEGELGKVERKLADENFTARAPEAVIAENQARRESFTQEIGRLDAALARIA